MKTLFIVLAFIAAFMLVCLNDLFAVVINVPDNFRTIQDAVNATEEGDTVLVQPGEYNERVGMPARNIVLASLRIMEDDDNIIERTIIDGVNINRSVIRVADGTDERTVIDGFTIINGATDYGAGIYIAAAGPTLRNLILANNNAERGGGGLYLTRISFATISNSIIRDNFGFIGGGIVVINGSRLIITDCLIEGNTSTEHGAGVHCTQASEVTLQDVIVRENVGTMFGGGLHANDRSILNLNRVQILNNRCLSGGGIALRASAVLNAVDVEVVGNSCVASGGGLYSDASFCTMTDCNFSSNSATNQGGGQYFWGGISEFTRCVVVDNECVASGAIHIFSADNTYRNCTVVNNRGDDASEIYLSGARLTLWNSIVWNENQAILVTSPENPDTVLVNYCDITGGQDGLVLDEEDIAEWGDGNINDDPLFADIEEFDYHLTEDSPCIDAGDPRAERDPDNTLADIGVFYFHQDEDPLPRRLEVPFEFETIQEALEASEAGDTILVYPGTYRENIRGIIARRTLSGLYILTGNPEHISTTIIDGENNETTLRVAGVLGTICGFTLINGRSQEGGGLRIDGDRNNNNDISNSINNMIIHDCEAIEDGGGIWARGDNVFDNVEIYDCNSESSGGGFYSLGSRITISDCHFHHNEAMFGGGIDFIQENGEYEIISSIIEENTASINGGGIIISCGSPLTISNSVIRNNVSLRDGGGITVGGESVLDCIHTLIENNNAERNGGGIFIEGAVERTFNNSTIVGNTANSGGGAYFNAINVTINNSIFRINEPQSMIATDVSEVLLDYSNVEGDENVNAGITYREGNIDEDPLFVDMENGDYQLTVNSPCIDVGDPDSPEDPDGTRADMGAFPFDQRDNPAELEHFADFVETDFQHTILVENFLFDGEVAPDDWEIAVFTREYVLSGAVLWLADEDVVLIAYGDNPDTDEIEGFYDGEWMMNFKAWDPEAEREYRVGYRAGVELELCHWHDGGETTLNLWSDPNIVEQVIELEEGENRLRINLLPSREFFADPDDEFPGAVQMVNQLCDRSPEGRENWLLTILRGANGLFLPEFNFDNLRWIIPGEDYQIDMIQPVTGTWWGMPIEGEPELRHYVDFTETDFTFELTIPEFLFDDEEVAAGWEIGVFTRDDVLAGAGVWTGEAMTFNVYGDNPETDEIEGFFEHEWLMNMHGWDPENDVEYRIGFRNNAFWSYFFENQGGADLELYINPMFRDQTLRFRVGWELVSLNILPAREFYAGPDEGIPSFEVMIDQIWGGRVDRDWDRHNLTLAKDWLGRFYAPAWGGCMIPGWFHDKGYQILTNVEISVHYWGIPIGAQEDLNLREGWNMVAYFPDYELDASAPDFYVLSNVIDQILLAKDNQGRFLTPEFVFSNMLPWCPGSGYQIKTNAECVLNYPEQRDEELNATEKPQTRHWDQSLATGNNMSLLVDLVEIDTQTSEIAAFSEAGKLVGCGVANEDGLCGLAVWGDDSSIEDVDGLIEGEAFTLKRWDAGAQTERELFVIDILKGEGLNFRKDGFSVLTCSEISPLPTEMKILSISPNPFNPTTTISYSLPQTSNITLKVYDISGRLVLQLYNGRQEAGIHSATVKADDWASGLYFARLEAAGRVFTQKIMLVK